MIITVSNQSWSDEDFGIKLPIALVTTTTRDYRDSQTLKVGCCLDVFLSVLVFYFCFWCFHFCFWCFHFYLRSSELENQKPVFKDKLKSAEWCVLNCKHHLHILKLDIEAGLECVVSKIWILTQEEKNLYHLFIMKYGCLKNNQISESCSRAIANPVLYRR